jgi:hypothetical protein
LLSDPAEKYGWRSPIYEIFIRIPRRVRAPKLLSQRGYSEI